ncbi:MAG: hypothetical protein OEY89_02345 [Gammaproteobacteria bacterium]|nr:hypothetical protein [Gammaproteobacteria bacterium]
MKLWKSISTVISLLFSTSLSAALIDNNTYTTDTISGLDWLDLSLTVNQAYNSVESLNPGWRYATNSEIENLFTTLFNGYFDTDTTQHLSDSNSGYINQNTDVIAFQELFGHTFNDPYVATYGLFEDENQTLHLMGAYISPIINFDILSGTTAVIGYDSIIFSPDYYNNQEDFREIAASTTGAYMVRATVVPIPAAVWLFCSGLISLYLTVKQK